MGPGPRHPYAGPRVWDSWSSAQRRLAFSSSDFSFPCAVQLGAEALDLVPELVALPGHRLQGPGAGRRARRLVFLELGPEVVGPGLVGPQLGLEAVGLSGLAFELRDPGVRGRVELLPQHPDGVGLLGCEPGPVRRGELPVWAARRSRSARAAASSASSRFEALGLGRDARVLQAVPEVLHLGGEVVPLVPAQRSCAVRWSIRSASAVAVRRDPGW